MIPLTKEAASILAILYGRKVRRAVEVGVRYGKTAESLLCFMPGVHLTLVDDWNPANEGPTGEGVYSLCVKRLQEHKGRVTILRERSPGASVHIGAGSQDFIHIDADHRYDSVLADCRAWWPKVRSGGVLIGHDYLSLKSAEWDVARAVRDFAEEVGEPFLALQMMKEPCGTWWMVKP